MVVHRKIKDLRENIKSYKKNFPEGRIALIPTMGYLHRGHLELIRAAKQHSDFIVVTIFVNKLQFNDPSDYSNYPIDESGDFKKCENEGADAVFAPSSEEMFGTSDPLVHFSISELNRNLCGKFRPGHFEGVLYIVSKIFNIVDCDAAFFGKKDYQQFTIIKKMSEELSFPIVIHGIPTVREDDGLAMSSRNARLSEKARIQAPLIHRALRVVEKCFREGRTNPSELTEIGRDIIESGFLNRVEYFDIVNPLTLQLIETAKDLAESKDFLIAAAVFCDGIRLIDNLEVQGA